VESSFLTRDLTLSLWSGSTDSKTLDYQRTNPREYQIVRTQHEGNHLHTRSGIIKLPVAPCAGHLTSTTNEAKIQTQSSAERSTTSLSLAHQQKNKQTNKSSAQISPYTKLIQTTGPTLVGQKPKGRKNSTFFKERIQLSLKPGKRRPQTQ